MPYHATAAERIDTATDGRHRGSAQADPALSANLWQEMALANKNALPLTDVNAVLGLVTVSDGKGVSGLTPDQAISPTSGECQPEYVTYNADKGGTDTAIREITPYGAWLKKLAGEALSEALPATPPSLTDVQSGIVDASVPLAKAFSEKLKLMQQGIIDPTMRDDFRELQKLLVGRMTPEESKNICDAINLELQKQGVGWLRIATSEISGEIWIGTGSGDKFTPLFEVKNKNGCPEMPQ